MHNDLHALPPAIQSALTAFCAAHDINPTEAVSEAISDHVTMIGPDYPGIALEDAIDDFIADAVTLWLDEQGGKLKIYCYFDFSPRAPRRQPLGEGAAPSPQSPEAPPEPRPAVPQTPGGAAS